VRIEEKDIFESFREIRIEFALKCKPLLQSRKKVDTLQILLFVVGFIDKPTSAFRKVTENHPWRSIELRNLP